MYKIPELAICCFAYLLSSSIPVNAEPLFGGGDNKDYVWKSGLNRYIKYARQDTAQFGDNDHPAELDRDEIKLALSALEVPDDGLLALSEETMRVFTVSQINLLSEQLAKGFKSAKPDQDLIFVLEKSERKFLGLQELRFLAGRAFYKDNRLNIIIGDYDFFRSKAFESVYDPSGKGAVPYDFNFGSRKKPSRAFADIFINIPGIENKKLNKIRHDWFVIDLNSAAQAFADKDKNKQQETLQDKRLAAEAAKLARERRLMRVEMARMRKEMKNGGNGGASAESIEARIATLDQLLDKKLITREEYDSKRKEILNDI